jgi:hypothetical protein
MFGNNGLEAGQQTFPSPLVRKVGGFDPAGKHHSQDVHKDVTLAPLDLLVTVEATTATAVGGLHRLAVHDDYAGTLRTPRATRVCW